MTPSRDPTVPPSYIRLLKDNDETLVQIYRFDYKSLSEWIPTMTLSRDPTVLPHTLTFLSPLKQLNVAWTKLFAIIIILY